MKDDIKRRCGSEKAADFRFHIMAVNTWMEIVSLGDIVPCEIGIVEMSLNCGIIRKYNQLIHPGIIPIGYKGDMKINADKYHGIYLNNHGLVNDYRDMVEKILDILKASEDEEFAGEGLNYPTTSDDPDIPECLNSARYHRLLPIYVIPDHKRDIEGSLKWLLKMSRRKDVSFMFYDLIFLFQQFLLASPFDIPYRISYGAAEAQILRDVFLYLKNVSCR